MFVSDCCISIVQEFNWPIRTQQDSILKNSKQHWWWWWKWWLWWWWSDCAMTSCLFSKSFRAHESSCLHCATRLKAASQWQPVSASVSIKSQLKLLKRLQKSLVCYIFQHTQVWFVCSITHILGRRREKIYEIMCGVLWPFSLFKWAPAKRMTTYLDLRWFNSAVTFNCFHTHLSIALLRNRHARDQRANI